MIKYCVYEGFEQLDSFKTLKEAQEYATKYINESIPYYKKNFGAYESEQITITKETYKLISFKNNVKLYRLTDKKEISNFLI